MSQRQTSWSTISESSVRFVPSGFVLVNDAAHAPQSRPADSFDVSNDVDNTVNKSDLDAPQSSDEYGRVMQMVHPEPRTSDSLSPVPFPPLSYAHHAPSHAPFEMEGISHMPQSQAKTADDRYDALLDRIDDQRWILRDQRESLHGGRVRLHDQRQELRETREKTMLHADAAFEVLKKYWSDQHVELPRDFGQTLENAKMWFARLEKQERDFQKAEEAYDMDEWIYTEQESKFVDDMCTSEPFTPAPAQQGLLQTEVLTQHASGNYDVRIFPTIAVKATASPPRFLPDEIAVSPYKGQSEARFTPMIDSTLEWSMTSKSLNALPSQLMPRLIPRPYSENDLTQVKMKWSDTRVRIEEWLLDALDQSTLQKDLLRQLSGVDALDFHAWWDLVLQHWKSDSPDDVAFHTGDTTMPPTTTGRRTSIIDASDVHDMSGAGTLEPPTPLISPLLSLDRVVDALDDFDFPTDIKQIDLSEPSLEAQFNEVPTIINGRSPLHRVLEWQESSSVQDLSELAIHEKYARATSEAEPVDQNVSLDEQLSIIPHHIDSPFKRSSWPPDTTNRTTAHDVGRPEAVAASGQLTPPTTLPFYIQVEDLNTWYLPLLRLTPNEPSRASPSHHTRRTTDNRLQALPFVLYTNSILRLPGPSPLC